MRQWQLQAAKARLSEVVRAAEEDGPQEVTLRGRAAAVVLAKADFDRLSAPKGSLVAFLRRSALGGAELQAARGRRSPRGARR